MVMNYRTLGPSGLRVSDLFLGTMTFGESAGWGAPIDECRKIFNAYAEAGGNVIDTANRYAEGASEEIVGELLGSERDRFVLATKYTVSTRPDDPNAAGSHRKSLHRSLEQSLTRLRTDYIDLLWVHIWDSLTPAEEMMRALDDAVRSGKVLYVGISDTPAWAISRAQMLAELRGWSPFIGLQMPYSLLQRDIERELLPMADELGLSVTAWSPLAGGRLTGKYTRGGQGGPTRVNLDEITDRELAIAREVDAVADELGVTSSQVALAWTTTRPTPVPIHPIIGARRLEQFTDNLAAAEVRLPDEAVGRLDKASAIELGFPHDFIDAVQDFVFGEVGERVTRGVRG